MRVGYACICLGKEELRSQRSTILKNASPDRLRGLISRRNSSTSLGAKPRVLARRAVSRLLVTGLLVTRGGLRRPATSTCSLEG